MIIFRLFSQGSLSHVTLIALWFSATADILGGGGDVSMKKEMCNCYEECADISYSHQ